jgi:lipid-A-disaccharide synthase
VSGPTKSQSASDAGRPLRIFLVAGEHSGDALGAKLMPALLRLHPGQIEFSGVGGEEMARAGLVSIFPIDDVAVMGPVHILPALPRLVRRVYQTVDAALAFAPDCVVIIDSPEFTHPIAKRIRKRAPHIPIIDYVSPSVWAWRPGRARKMRAYVDEILGLLPFEPAAHVRLGGPHCTYVGHPLIERLDEIAAADRDGLSQRLGIPLGVPVLLILPGSRRSEVERLMGVFGETVALLRRQGANFETVILAMPHVREVIAASAARWPGTPHVVDGTVEKFSAMRLARAALAASGTVTLELALAGTPMAVGYKVDAVMAPFLRRMIQGETVVLANLVLGSNAFPEFMQEECTAEKLSAALMPLMAESPARRAQLLALQQIAGRMSLPSALSPSEAAAQGVLATVDRHSAGKSRRG